MIPETGSYHRQCVPDGEGGRWCRRTVPARSRALWKNFFLCEVACQEDGDTDDYFDGYVYVDVSVRDLEVEAALPGYPVLTVRAAACTDPLAEVKLEVWNCDSTLIKTCHRKVCQKDGGKICLPTKVKARCVRVKSGNATSADLVLPHYHTFNHSHQIQAISWEQQDDTNISKITMIKQTGVYKYLMNLTPSHTQSTAGGAAKGGKVPLQKQECTLSKPVILEGVNHDNTTTFTAHWHNLNTTCVYRTRVTPYNPCEEPFNFGVTFPDLQYKTLDKPVEQREVAVWVVVVVAVFTLVSTLLVCYHLYNTCRFAQSTIVRRNSNGKKPGCLEEMQQEVQVLKHSEHKQNCLGDGGRETVGLRDALLSGAEQRKVLMVYARDAQEQVAALTNLLHERTNYQILDLYDPLDLDKLRDGTVWLARRLLDPATVTLLVASKQARKLQVLHASTLGHGTHTKPQQSLDYNMLTENTASQMAAITTAGDDRVGHMKFDNIFVQNVNKKVKNDTKNFSSKVEAGQNFERASLLMSSSPDKGGEEVRKNLSHVGEKGLADARRSLPAPIHQKCLGNITEYRDPDTCTHFPHSQVMPQDGAIKTCIDRIEKTNEAHDNSETNIDGRKIISKAGIEARQVKLKVNEKVEMISKKLQSNRAEKEQYEEPRHDGAETLPDSEDDQVGQEVFHFLFLDFLHKLEASFFSHDYDRLYQIKFRETPELEVLDHVTPGRLYHLPDHLDHLIYNLTYRIPYPGTCNTPRLDTYLHNCL
ncbi:uncharacterized protein [Procambarus clarkii]|uniref:uncharacterized protein isoform X1 n=1 Tax=Procambarus clarkii TaxID=6728 RepID=UPI003742E00E